MVPEISLDSHSFMYLYSPNFTLDCIHTVCVQYLQYTVQYSTKKYTGWTVVVPPTGELTGDFDRKGKMDRAQ